MDYYYKTELKRDELMRNISNNICDSNYLARITNKKSKYYGILEISKFNLVRRGSIKQVFKITVNGSIQDEGRFRNVVISVKGVSINYIINLALVIIITIANYDLFMIYRLEGKIAIITLIAFCAFNAINLYRSKEKENKIANEIINILENSA